MKYTKLQRKKEMNGGEAFLWFMGLLCLFTYLFSLLEQVTK